MLSEMTRRRFNDLATRAPFVVAGAAALFETACQPSVATGPEVPFQNPVPVQEILLGKVKVTIGNGTNGAVLRTTPTVPRAGEPDNSIDPRLLASVGTRGGNSNTWPSSAGSGVGAAEVTFENIEISQDQYNADKGTDDKTGSWFQFPVSLQDGTTHGVGYVYYGLATGDFVRLEGNNTDAIIQGNGPQNGKYILKSLGDQDLPPLDTSKVDLVDSITPQSTSMIINGFNAFLQRRSAGKSA